MSQPQIQFIPLRTAVATNKPEILDVLIRILPPPAPKSVDRPALNLGLVIDRSGSMEGEKIVHAREAARFAIEQLQASDRVSVTIFDDEVETLVSSTLANDKRGLLKKIDTIQPGGSTALHEAWRQGGIQVSQHLQPDHLNRVIVLSDGLANVGETNSDRIANDVHGLARHGVSTSTMGVGNDYNEDLMQAMANSGDGNYYYIESPKQLSTIFAAELKGLMATCGHTVSLGLEGLSGVEVLDVLNDFETTSTRRFKLPTLLWDEAIEVVVRLKVPALAADSEVLKARLAWNAPGQAERLVLRAPMTIRTVAEGKLSDFPPNEEVQRQVALFMTARARQEAVRHLDRGDREAASRSLGMARECAMAAPASPKMAYEAERLEELSADIASGDVSKARKKATFQSYERRSGKA